MSLKAFHVFFVAVAALFSVGLGFWALRDYRGGGPTDSLYMAIASFAGTVVLVVYGAWFLRKLKHVNYI